MAQVNKFYTGDLICKKDNPNRKGIVEYSYKDAFKHGSSSEYSVLWLNAEGKPSSSSAWHYQRDLVLLDSSKREKNLQIIVKYNKKCGDGAPIAMDPKFAESQGFDYVHSYESATAQLKRKYGNY